MVALFFPFLLFLTSLILMVLNLYFGLFVMALSIGLLALILLVKAGFAWAGFVSKVSDKVLEAEDVKKAERAAKTESTTSHIVSLES